MKRLFIGLVIGSVLASVLASPAVLFVKTAKFNHGRAVGYPDGQCDTVAFLRKHFQVAHLSRRRSEMKAELFTKAGNVHVIETNGVLTIEID